MDSFLNSNGKCSRDLPAEVSISNESRCSLRTQSDWRNQFSNQKRKSLNFTVFQIGRIYEGEMRISILMQ